MPDLPPPPHSKPSPLGPIPTRVSAPSHQPSSSPLLTTARGQHFISQSFAPAEFVARPGHLLKGIIGGLSGALLGAVMWAVVTLVSGVQIGFVAIGVAFLAGWGVRTLGRGDTQAFALVGALCSMLGVLLGKALSILWMFAVIEKIPLASILVSTPWSIFIPAVFESLDLADFLFVALALYLGFKLSLRSIS